MSGNAQTVERLADIDPHGVADAVALLPAGSPLTPAALQRLACDARIQWIYQGPDGRPLGVGETTRTHPPGCGASSTYATAAPAGSDRPPIIRIAYVWFADDATREELAVVMLMGDKTTLGNNWYPSKINAIENTLVPDWERTNPHHAQVRRTR